MIDSSRLVEEHRRRYGASARVFVVRAPGRVNLIGEHTDYNGLPVLPMAIEREICLVATARDDRTVKVCNLDPVFPDASFELGRTIPPSRPGSWDNYFKAAITGLAEWLSAQSPERNLARGMNVTATGDVPVAAGLSSSSALVVAAALAFLATNGIEVGTQDDCVLDRIELAQILAAAERYVGTQGGGMDQAISLLGTKGNALKIEFFPLRTEAVPLPQDYSVVICNSLVKAEKSADALVNYNLGPVTCRLAAALLGSEFETRCRPRQKIERLGDINPESLGMEQGKIDEVVSATLGDGPLRVSEIALRLHLSVVEVRETYLRMRTGDLLPEPPHGFNLMPRVRHVLTEARRVTESVAALRAGDAARFGYLMDESHASCRDDFRISSPELDALVDAAKAGGAVGARLTGAGFGGCTVNLVHKETLPRFAGHVRSQYYEQYITASHPELSDLAAKTDEHILVCEPAEGASISPFFASSRTGRGSEMP